MTKDALRIGIDIGGTFTDFVVFDPSSGSINSIKLLSTPDNPAQSVLEGLQRLGAFAQDGRLLLLVHGSTVATNALLERKGARTALITTRGFADVIQIGRQNRPELYNLFTSPAPVLVPSELRFEVDERIDRLGQILRPLEPDQVDRLIPQLRTQKVESVAICLLFSFLHPEHENQIAERLRQAGFTVSTSSEILPEYREYERMSTTVINAYVSPILERYLDKLEASLPDNAHLRIMQSNGGVIASIEARRSGVRSILSGPAGGVVGSRFVAEKAIQAFPDRDTALKLITFDMGGTSTDVSLIDGFPLVTAESQINGLPIRIPVLDIHTIGAGGGSIAVVDPGGALRVGPQSAGAIPGPACYSPSSPGENLESAFPTVTDANLVLGRLVPDHFLGGRMPLNLERAKWVMQRLGEQLGLGTVQTALGIVDVVNAHMERALRVISIERGYDPQDFSLLSFGGAGGLHAADLARKLGIPRIIVPPYASVLSALGMLVADVVKDYSQTIMLPGSISSEQLLGRLSPIQELAFQEMAAEGIAREDLSLEPALDMRYQGQSYELTIPWRNEENEEDDLIQSFHQTHQRVYGYTQPEAPVEIVNLRLRAVARVPPLTLPSYISGETSPEHALIDHRPVVLRDADGSPLTQILPLYRGEALQPGNRLAGPALIVRTDTTILLAPNDQGKIDEYQNLWISFGNPSFNPDASRNHSKI